MKKQIQQVTEFHRAFKLPVREHPTIVSIREFKLRQCILQEEVDELKNAATDGSIINIADALTDIMYVLIGTAIQYGLASVLEKCFDEVHRSNMTKLDANGLPIFREDGKILKGIYYESPDLSKIIKI